MKSVSVAMQRLRPERSCENGFESASTTPRLLAVATASLLVVFLLASVALGSRSTATRANTLSRTGAPGGINSLTASAQLPRHGPEWYFRSGKWRADTLTFFAAVRYLLEPEPLPQTNYVPVRA